MAWITLFATLAEAEARVAVGQLFKVRLPGPPFRVLLLRRADGTWRAFEDACPHKKAAFSVGGYLNVAGEIVCPLHHYAFELDTGQETTGQACPHLHILPIEAGPAGLRLKVY